MNDLRNVLTSVIRKYVTDPTQLYTQRRLIIMEAISHVVDLGNAIASMGGYCVGATDVVDHQRL